MSAFADTFARPNGDVGNGWTPIENDAGYHLVLVGGKLTTPGTADSVDGAIYRPLDLSGGVVLSADLTEANGFGGLLERYQIEFLFANDGTLTGGYGLRILRSDENSDNSRVQLIVDGTVIGSIDSNFQFGHTIHATISVTDAGISGAIEGDSNTFNFDFGPQPIDLLTPANFAVRIEPPDSHSGTITNATIDNLTIMSAPSAQPFELSSLDGMNGFIINGAAAGDSSGISVASAGDVNGDGFADVIIGAWGADPHGSNSGASYIVFGKATGFPAGLDLADLDGTNGFSLNGAAAGDTTNGSAPRLPVSSAGDINGDGFDDIIVGAKNADPGGLYSAGASYVVFGKVGSFGASLDLSGLNGATGFVINGLAAGDSSGYSVASAGDVNGDGFDDLIVGAYGVDSHGSGSGTSYVVFGKVAGYAPSFDLSGLNGANGFAINGVAAADYSGTVSSAGDVNGDGFADLMIGARGADPHGYNSGASYVMFGKASGFSASLDLSTLDGTNGFALNGVSAYDAGSRVASAGDINGDGYTDIIVGAWGSDTNANNAGASYVVFGKASGFAASMDLSSLDGTNGFTINGVGALAESGWAIASAGDVDGDGFDDILIGAHGAEPHFAGSGATYLIYGRASGFASVLEVTDLDGTNGFVINGVDYIDRSGWSVASAGDVNADGLSDVVIGAWGADPNGKAEAGSSYVVFGTEPITSVIRTGTVASQSLVGGQFDDTLSGLGGDDNLWGHAGDDYLDGGLGADYLNGGDGDDILEGGAGADTLIGGSGSDTVSYSTATIGVGVNLDIGATGLQGDTIVSIENVTGSAFNDQLTGDGGVNVLRGLAGDDYLDGKGGADTMIGGPGNDEYIVDHVGDVEIELPGEGPSDSVRSNVTYTLPDNIELLILIGGGNIDGTGNALNNTITGTTGANTLIGLEGDDSFLGSGGADTMIGGPGHDAYIVDEAGDVVVENFDEGTDAITAQVSYTLGANVEIMQLGGFAANGTGNSLDNLLTGNGSPNTLDGGAGADSMFGRFGDDIYIVDNPGDTVTELPGEGTDTVQSAVSFTLAAYVENLTLTGGSAIDGTGNSLANILAGNSVANALAGGDGSDQLSGNSGNDTLSGGRGHDLMSGGANDDTLAGDGGIDRAVYSVNHSAYTLTHNTNGSWTISGPDGTDTLTTVERAVFSDQTVSLRLAPVFDFSGEGNGDILFQNNATAQVAVWTQNGLTSTSADAIAASAAGGWVVKAASDIDGDANADILLQNSGTGEIAAWLMNGLTVLGADAVHAIAGTQWSMIGTGDFNNDLKYDILLQNNTSSQIAVWLMNGLVLSGGDAIAASASGGWQIKGIGDFNGDGKSDVLLQNSVSNQVSIWLMNGLAVQSADLVAGGNTGTDWRVKGTGDFNGDGKSDVLLQNASTSEVAVWFMNGLAVNGGDAIHTAVASGAQVKGAEDLNGDGSSDILFQNANGTVSAWLMNGLQVATSGNIGSNPGSAWQVIAPTG